MNFISWLGFLLCILKIGEKAKMQAIFFIGKKPDLKALCQAFYFGRVCEKGGYYDKGAAFFGYAEGKIHPWQLTGTYNRGGKPVYQAYGKLACTKDREKTCGQQDPGFVIFSISLCKKAGPKNQGQQYDRTRIKKKRIV